MAEPVRCGRGHVLLVDDEPQILEALSILMDLEGFRVTLARDGIAALEKLAEACPDLVLTDLMMPRLDGVGLARAIRADPVREGLPLVLSSAAIVDEEAWRGLFDAFVQKGRPFEDILQVLDELLAR